MIAFNPHPLHIDAGHVGIGVSEGILRDDDGTAVFGDDYLEYSDVDSIISMNCFRTPATARCAGLSDGDLRRYQPRRHASTFVAASSTTRLGMKL